MLAVGGITTSIENPSDVAVCLAIDKPTNRADMCCEWVMKPCWIKATVSFTFELAMPTTMVIVCPYVTGIGAWLKLVKPAADLIVGLGVPFSR